MLKLLQIIDFKDFSRRRKAVQNWYREMGYRSILEAEADGQFKTMQEIFNNA